jgi:hypothetical protein
MGRKYPVSRLRDIIRGTYDMGYVFDSVNKIFVENPRYKRTRNWGVLEPGMEYTIALLRLDIVGNSGLVRRYPRRIVQTTYADLRAITNEVIGRRNGRIWTWEGDGGLVAFYFGNKHTSATLCAMEILHELFLYNRIRCPFGSPLQVRIGVHAGQFEYTDSKEALGKIDTVREVDVIQRNARPDTAQVSIVVKVMLDELLTSELEPVDGRKNTDYRYRLRME